MSDKEESRNDKIYRLQKKLCQCSKCAFFGICPEFAYQLTDKDLEYLEGKAKNV
jgi:hypothetical protein